MVGSQNSPSSALGSQQLAESVLISRQVFETRLRGVAFDSWDSFRAAVADSQPQVLHHEGESGSVFKLDPLRVFGWVATILINVCVWGMVSCVAAWSQLLGLACVLIYGVILWWVVTRQLSPALAGVLWPMLPCTVAAAGLLVGLLLFPDFSHGDRGNVCLLLALGILPQTMSAAYFLRDLPQDPDRATLVLNFFFGAWAFVLAVFALAVGPEAFDSTSGTGFYFTWGSLLFFGLAAVLVAGRLFVVPNVLGSVEAVSWTLNVGVVAVLVSVQALLEVPFAQDIWRWLVFAAIVAGIGLVGAVFERSLPVLLSAVGCLMIAIYFSAQITAAAGNLGVPSSVLTFVNLATFGALGILIAVAAQLLWQSKRFSDFMTQIRFAHSRAYRQTLLEDSRAAIDPSLDSTSS